MRVLVTGAAGFIGRAVSVTLRDTGVDVVGLDRTADPARGVVAGDVTAPDGWRAALTGCDAVVHTAAVVSNAVGRDEQWRVNVLGTRRVVEAAAAAGVARVVHLSSIRAFSDAGFPDGVTEDHPVRPDGSAYVDTKIASEHVALAAHAAGEVEVVVLRPGDVYGPGSRPWVLLPLELIRAGTFMLPARGRGVFSPVHVDDLVRGVLLAAAVPAAAGQVVTLAGPGVPCAEYFGHLYRHAGRRPRLLPTAAVVALSAALDGALRAGGRRGEVNPESARYLARTGGYSSVKARRLLGWTPEVGLQDGMARTVEWLQDQGL